MSERCDGFLTTHDAIREEYERTGMIAQSFPLANAKVLPELLRDAVTFDTAVEELAKRGRRSVPYICTDAIRAVAGDEKIVAVVRSLLGPDEPWVMWGPNIRRGTPNSAHAWHVDLESWYWPSITVVVGLAGCTAENATRYIPYSHKLKHAPTVARNTTDEAYVLRTAKSLNGCCQSVRTFTDFGAGRFYVFNARGWHCGAPASSRDRLALFMHYHRARDPRVPYMKDYDRGTWFEVPAPYVDSFSQLGNPRVRASQVHMKLYRLPWKTRIYAWSKRLLRIK